ncbi:MAG: pyridoxamine 5-phosphate oxidase [Alphaproteobacteria bacterium]|nr:pyridoxamine 5-phosphate oxidase [Alphaproteobacteria bacterium]
MTKTFAEVAFTAAVKAAQEKMGSRAAYAAQEGSDARRFTLDEDVRAFMQSRDHFFVATVSETGWPYVQHRGGPPGFVKALDGERFAFPDFRGNRQYVFVGNLSGDDRAAFIFMDYPRQARLKALARIHVVDKADDPDLMQALALPGYKGHVERAFVATIEALDWNCPQHITPRFSEAELADALAPMRDRLASLEAENAALKAQLAQR